MIENESVPRFNILDNFNDRDNGKSICIMPVPRLLVQDRFCCRDVYFYPADSIDFSAMRIVSTPRDELENALTTGGGTLEWMKSSATGLDIDDLQGLAFAACYLKVDQECFLTGDHEYHKFIISEAAEAINQALDIVRFDYCSLGLPDTLPGFPGTLTFDRGPFSTCLVCSNNADHEIYMIGAQTVTHHITTGLGLEIDNPSNLTEFDDGETGNLLRHALRLRSSAMESNSLTSKFVASISVLDFLSNPNGYADHNKIAQRVALHMSSKRQDYDPIKHRVEEIMGGKGSGIRTKLVHEGQRLEDVVETSNIVHLFREIDRYIGKIISDLQSYSNEPWDKVQTYRESKMVEIGLK